MCVCVFFLIQIDRMLRRLCAHYNYTHLRNVGSRCWRGGCNQRSLCQTRTHLTFLQRLATHLFALESNLRMKKISQVHTHTHTHKGSITVIIVIISDSCCLIIKSVIIITIIITFIVACCWQQSLFITLVKGL